uniref:Epiplakin 1 n=1 Tax=Xenopus tropicalis TaxID=8364 RepID=A0A803JR42_XENTR
WPRSGTAQTRVVQSSQSSHSAQHLRELQASGPTKVSPSIAGFFVEKTKEKISIYQALQEKLVTSEVALSLLEAQAATGNILDPKSNQKLSVEAAIGQGIVGLELKEKLLSAERSVTGFSDPYTDSRISLFQAIKKELIDKNLGMNLLQVQKATGGFIDPVNSFHVPVEVAYQQGLLDEEMNRLLSDPLNGPKGFLDPNTNDAVTYAELKKRCIVDPETKVFFFPVKLTFQGIRGKVTADELLDSLIIDRETFENLQQGRTSDKEVADRELVRQYLEGTGCIAGVVIVSSSETKSLYQAMKEHYLMSGTSIALLEAQAATGGLIDPIKNLKFSVDEAVKNGLAGPELYEKLLSAEKATTGYRDPYNGQKVSLFQAIKGGFVERHHGIQLLEVQMATGGIIDPLHKHRVPKEVAYKRGLFDDDMNKNILAMMEEPKGYFDPNLKVNINYGQMLHKCLVDLATGLYLLPIFDQTQQTCPNTLIDFQTTMTLKAAKIPVTSGKYKAQTVSIWELLFSDYFTTEERISLVYRFKCQTVTLEGLSNQINTNIQQIVSSTKISFEGLRERVTPKQLLNSDIIDKTLYEKLEQGEASVKDVVNMDTVKKYLQGTGCIGGLILTETQEKMSIYQAKRKALLRPGTSLILLEAQAATGFIIDPVENKKYSVEEALKANVIGPEFYEKLLSAEKSVTGYIDPYTEKTISLFQAMSKGLIVKEHGIRLLEAQIASGGIIDPINSHRIPVEVAYKRGYFDKKMNLILSDPSDDTKGFFDPNTNENLTYLQLKEKCITEPTTNLCLLPLRGKKSLVSINDSVKASLSNLEIYVRYGRFRQKTVSAWVLINSEYFSEWKRRYIVEQYRLQKKTLKEIAILIEEEMNKWTDIRFPALRGQVNIHQLLEYEIIDKELFQQVLDGKVKVEDVMKTEKVQRHLHGSDILGGVILQPSNQRISFLEATKKRILLPSTVLPILEAQAATGHIIDPISNQKLTVDEALKAGVIDPQHYDKLLTAEEAVTGYKDPFTGRRISLYQAMRKGLVDEKHAIQLLDAQLATGGIIDPDTALHLPVSVANKHGFFNDELHQSLSTDALNSYCDPTTKQMVSYSELVSRSEQDKPAGIRLIPLPEGFTEVPTDNIFSEEEVKETFKNTRIEERNTTLWVLIHYGYFTEEQRSQILERYKLKKATLQEVTTEILQFIKDNEIKMTTHISFEGLRGKVPAIRLLDLGILNQTVFNELLQGLKTTEEVSKLESVKKYLQGTGYISGVFLQSTKEKMSIYQAMKRNLIMPANGLLFLEAQAATGFLIDPVYNQKYSVDSAVKAGVVGPELHEKLLTAESAVTGFLDPYTGNKISLLQAIGKDLLLRNEAIPLLQAQIAAGGIVDPNHCHYVPLEMAHKLGFLDEEVDVAKSTISLKAFYDPDTKENLSYMELKDKCYKDPETGLLLLPLSESAAIYADENIISVLKSVTVNVQAGRFKGQVVSVWELLNSEYISVSKLKELLALYSKSSAEALQLLIQTVTTIIIESEKESKKIHFKGLRRQVSASDLFLSEVIDKQTLDDLNLGKKTITEVTEMDNVKRYLEGTNCIAGVLVQATNKKMSIYEAMLKGILRPGTALVLLEAQAATGFIVDPVKNMKLSVDEALGCRLIGQEIYKKLLSAEQAVTGYTDPHNEEKISLFQAMNKKLIVESHGIRLLEAQIATGGIIDPVHSHRIPVDTAYKRGYFNEEMNTILSDPSDDTKGFFDPNTHENLTYLQLVERCIQDPETGLYLLQVVKKGENYFYITDKIKEDLQSKRVLMHHGSFTNQTVSLWEILSSHYVTDLKRRELVRLYIEGVMTEEHLLSSVTTLIMDYESKSNILMFKGIRGEVSATELFNAEIIDKKTLDDLRAGKKTVEDIAQVDSIKTYLEGTGCIAGAFVLPDNEKLSVYEAIKKGILPNDIGLTLLEAQVATGFLIDPVKNKRLSVSEALSAGLIGTDVQNKLELAEQAVTGFTDPDSGNKLSLFQAIKKGLINRDQGLYLLEAQLCTGGVINPLYSHRVPLGAAYKKGLLDEDTYILLSDGKKGFTDPNTHERISYKNLMERCTKDTTTGLDLLQLAKKRDDYFYIDNPTKNILTSTPLKMHAGKFQGQDVSLWDILCSIYISEEKRKELIKKYKSETTATLKSIIATILSIIEKKETTQSDIWFQGLRKRQVTATELLTSEIIDQDTLRELAQGKKTVEEVTEMDTVKRYLEGESCIAGILVPSAKEPSQKDKMSIYNAMQKNILRPGTALVLLEAQAATGFVIDPINNKKLSVDEAVAAGVIGKELHGKLLSAERAVTGYKDPYTGDKVSLFQAMQKELIVKDHGIRLLEAQIATGGIIDPLHSHRVPVDIAYKRGYFDEEMNQILSDPSDDTKGFFDPNTHENLTYMQLLQRCIKDSDTGLCLLEVSKAKSTHFKAETNFESRLKSLTVHLKIGHYQGQNVSLWELLNSHYFSEEKRQELLLKYKTGAITINELQTIVITTTEELESKKTGHLNGSVHEELDQKTVLSSAFVQVTKGKFMGQKISIWELLNSEYITEEKRKEILQKYSSGAWTMEEIITLITTIIAEVEENREKLEKEKQKKISLWEILHTKYISSDKRNSLLNKHQVTVETLKGDIMKLIGEKEVKGDEEVKQTLELKFMDVRVGKFKGQQVSLWVLLHSKYISEEKRKELLEKYKSGTLTLEEMFRIIITIIEETEEKSHNIKFTGLRRQVTATELLESQIIDQSTMNELTQGSRTVEQVTQMDSVKRYLQGTSPIAGVFVTSKKEGSQREKMTIYDAMFRRILRPGTALVLLEAQAATGFVVDPIQNRRLSVEEAKNAGLIGHEIYNKLLSAERGVTGYTDPYTGNKISLFQAMKKELIVKDHGIRLLEAQIATGGIIDPVHSHRVPVEVAYKRGYFDEEMNQILSDPSDDTKGFFDPNTHENLTYMQLLQRCVEDPETGMFMLDVKDTKPALVRTDYTSALQSKTVLIQSGEFQGKNVSVWELLSSKYVSAEKREELLRTYRAGSLSIEELITIVITIINETEASVSSTDSTDSKNEGDEMKILFQSEVVSVPVGDYKGQRVSLWELLHSHYISEEKRNELLDKVKSRTLTLQETLTIIIRIIEETELTRSKTVQRPPQVLVEQGLKLDLTVHADEIQKSLQSITVHVRTGEFQGQDVSVWDLLHSRYISEEMRKELVSNYDVHQLIRTKTVEEVTEMDTEPSQKDKMSIYNAMQKNILRPGTALVLLEAQAATGFVIDPINNKKLSVDEAVAAGVIGKELHGKLLSAERAVTGYKDPYTGDKVSLFQAMQKELIVKDHGIRLLEAQIATGGIIDPLHSHRVPVDIAYKRGYFDEEMNQILSDPSDDTKGFFDPNTHENLTYMQLLQRCIKDSDTGLCLLEISKAKSTHFKAETNFESRLKSLTVHLKIGHYQGQNVSLWELLNSHYFSEEKRQELLLKYKTGAITINELQTIVITTTEELESKKTGHLNGSVHEELDQKTVLSSAFVQVTKGKFMGQKISVWELLNSEYFTEEKRKEILQKYSSGAWTMEEIITLITTIIAEKEKISLWEILHTKYISSDKRNSLLNKHQVTIETLKGDIMKLIGEKEVKGDEEVKQTLELKFMDVRVGKFKGQQVSLWVLLHSKYISEEKRKELLEKYKSGTLTLEEMFRIIITITEETEEKSHNIKFTGLRRQVTATELLESQIIDQSTMNELTQGSRTVEQVTQMDSVKRYLQGTSPIAGVFVTSKKEGSQREKMTIYDAMFRRILRPGTALVLLEAQAATGFVIDPIQNRRLSVEEAKNAGLIGHEIYNKLLSAERGVTGYTDPYTGNKISLFQAMKKELIVKDHGIRLLEAQIATGGIIDPVHSHRVPVEVAYKRGYFDEEMNQILSDPSDDTKGFFDPNTHENLTYMQLLQRCVEDPETGMFMLDVKDTKPALVRTDYTSALQSKTVLIQSGEFQGKNVSVWELLHSHYISKEKREELLKKYSSGSLSATDLEALILTIISETERERVVDVTKEDPKIHTTLKSVTIDISVGSFQTKTTTIWDLLQSDYFSERERNDLLEKLHAGTLTLEEIIKFIVTVVTEKETKTLQSVTTTTQIKREEVVQKSIDLSQWPPEEQLQKALEAIPYEVSRQQNLGEKQDSESIWGVLQSEKLPDDQRKELLKTCKDTVQDVLIEILMAYLTGSSSIQDIIRMITTIIEETEDRTSKLMFQGLRQQVTAAELLSSEIIDQKTLDDLSKGNKTLEEITQMDSVKRYLEGTSCIAGVFAPSKKHPSKMEKMSIYQAMRKNILRPERAVTGYRDPYSGDKISLFQAMKKNLIVKDHGVRLLEAQIATGGVIDPVYSHRVPVSVAYKRGYFDEEMNQVLCDPSDDTKGFFDPNTHENLTYMQLVQRCVQDPDTGLNMLEVKDVKSPLFQIDKTIQSSLQSQTMDIKVGQYKGQNVSVWELLTSRYLCEADKERQDLLMKYKSGAITIQKLMAELVLLVEKLEEKRSSSNVAQHFSEGDTDKEKHSFLQSVEVEVTAGHLKGQKSSLWQFLNSSYITAEKRNELLIKYESGALTLEQLVQSVLAIMAEAEKTVINGSDGASVGESGKAGAVIQSLSHFSTFFSIGEFQGPSVSLWDILHSKTISRAERDNMLKKYLLTIEEVIAVLSKFFPSSKGQSAEQYGQTASFLKSVTVQVAIGEFKVEDTLIDLTLGKKTLAEVTEMDSVRRYLEGTSCIAGVLVTSKTDPSKKEKMSIYTAMLKGILRPGTALVLLEAQAATGFVIDPIKNIKLSVDEAAASGVIGQELHSKLLSAEKAVTGYNDPSTSQKISLFQAMQKELIVQHHGIRLLEAQIATGGIIDPVHSHRVPVEVAYKRGYFDEEMNKILDDPTDDTKGFFDPNTHENLTYMQLLQRCVQDPDTGLFMLGVSTK